jgi:hypothetical protein
MTSPVNRAREPSKLGSGISTDHPKCLAPGLQSVCKPYFKAKQILIMREWNFGEDQFGA